MKKTLTFKALALVAAFICAAPLVAHAEGNENAYHEELEHHPNMAQAIQSLENALNHMKAAPSVWDGHKANAMRDTQNAIKELKQALTYRAHADHEKHERQEMHKNKEMQHP